MTKVDEHARVAPLMRHRVLRHGERLVDRDQRARIRLETSIMSPAHSA